MWKKIYATAFANLTLVVLLFGQATSVLDVNNLNFTVNSNGILGMDISNMAHGCEVPAGSGTHALFSSGLWVGGIDLNGQLRLAAQQYESTISGDYWSGPLTINGTATIDPNVSAQYDHVWTVHKADVDLHIAYFDCVHDPNCDENVDFPGYQIPQYFLDWPAHGDISLDQAFYLAPFEDRNDDGLYDPLDGDYPCMPGDQAKYIIFNDAKGHAYSGGQQLGIEVHAIVFGFNTSDPDIDNTVFVHYRFNYRATETLQDLHFGVFADFDLGNPSDDYLGSDIERNLMYVMNGDNFDEDGSAVGYGSQPPAFGISVLQGPFMDMDNSDDAPNSYLEATGYGFNDGIIDNERYGPTVMTYMGGGTGPTGSPSTAPLRWNRLAGFWNDGTHMVYGGSGHISDANADPNTQTSIIYPGDSDPTGMATSDIPQTPWSEAGSGHFPNDRRALIGFGPKSLPPGTQWNEITLAYTYARASSGGPEASVAELQSRVDAVKTFYDNEVNDYCGWKYFPDAVGIADIEDRSLSLYPSPALEMVYFDITEISAGATYELLDTRGRLVRSAPVVSGKNTIDISEMQNGIYFLQIISDDFRYIGRVVKQ